MQQVESPTPETSIRRPRSSKKLLLQRRSHLKTTDTNFRMASLETRRPRWNKPTAYKNGNFNHFFGILKHKPHKWDVGQTVPVIKANYCIKTLLDQSRVQSGTLRLTRRRTELARYKITKQVQSSSTAKKTFQVFINGETPSLYLWLETSESFDSPKRQHRESIQGTSVGTRGANVNYIKHLSLYIYRYTHTHV